MANIIHITDFQDPRLDIYARLTENQLINRHEPEKGLFIAMPSKKALDGEYRDIAHPINSDTRNRIQSIILEKYEQALTEEDGEDQE